jgi:GTP-binding protein HflX
MKDIGAEVLIIGNAIKPRQLYTINEALRPIKAQCRDRVDLILKIFDQHAVSTESKLQIELAAIKHM